MPQYTDEIFENQRRGSKGWTAQLLITDREAWSDKIFEKYLGGSPKQLLPHLLKWLDEMATHATEPGPPR